MPRCQRRLTLANARLILPGREMTGRVTLEGGEIVEIAGGAAVARGGSGLRRRHRGAGAGELHTDNLERHIRPRPSAHWPHKPAIVAHDAELAACGITTVFDAIRVGSIEGKGGIGWLRYARDLADELLLMAGGGRAEDQPSHPPARRDLFGVADRGSWRSSALGTGSAS